MQNRILQLRKELHMTQTEFGERIGMGKTGVSKMEHGESKPSKLTLKAIIREYNVNYNWLVDGDGQMFSNDCKDILNMIELLMKDATEEQRNAFRSIANWDSESWVLLNNFVREVYPRKKK